MKLLVLSYFFAPSSCANAKRPFYIVKGFLDAGWEVDVISSYRLMSPSQPELLAHPRLSIKRVRDPREEAEKKLSGPLGRILTLGIRGLLWPDAFILWFLRVCFLIKFEKYDRILVCVYPISAILILLNRKTAKRAVVDFQESLAPNTTMVRKAPLDHLLAPLLARLQRMVLRQTLKTVFATRSYIQEYVRYGLIDASKAVHVPFFYDDTAFKNNKPPSDRFVISYFGQFGQKQGIRSPEPFFRALKLFLERNPQARSLTTFRFYGPWIEEHSGLVRDLGLEDVVQIHLPVPYDRYLDLLSRSNVLLLVASRDQNFFVPSKMLDYFGAKRPILGFVPPDSETYSILKEAGMAQYVSDEADAEGGARGLEQLWQAWKAGGTGCLCNNTEQWSASVQVPRIIHLVTDLK